MNFENETEEAFNFYKEVFQTDFTEYGIMRYGDIPANEDAAELSEEDKKLIMHVELPIFDGYTLMGSDMPESMDFKINKGNNAYIMLQPDTRTETNRIFNLLAQDGIIEAELQDMFWGDYYGSLVDKFGVSWMLNCSEAHT